MSQKYFRENIAKMKGYAPGEQPKIQRLVKLNTNENPYPPSPLAIQALRDFDCERLRRYPDPVASDVIDAATEVYGVSSNQVIVGNGSDDILTIIFRSFAGESDTIAWLDPSYSLYPVLADLQGADHLAVSLNEDFSLPEDLAEQSAGASLLLITCPNAPTGNSFDETVIRRTCEKFEGIVVIDEAYADFSDVNFLGLIHDYDNVVVTRTFSKSYSLAGIRLGMAFANSELIAGMMKVKDSYNVNFLTCAFGAAALRDQPYFKECTGKVIKTREKTKSALEKLGFEIVPSQTNFLFAKVPGDAAAFFNVLRNLGIIVRYFPAERTKDYIRITIGTDEEMSEFLKICKENFS